ncbi:MAG TPA: hypothetical protein VF189_04130 [Patescibacteria group bacterium]
MAPRENPPQRPEINDENVFGNQSRREFSKKAIGFTAALATFETVAKIYVANKIKDIGLGFLTRERGKIDLLRELMTFLTAPSPDTLLSECYNANKEIMLSSDQMQNVTWYVFGDSMNLAYGKHQGPEDQTLEKNAVKQKNSWVQMLVDGVNNAAERLNIKGKWRAFNLARLGSSTIGLVGDDKMQSDGNVQLGNSNVQKRIENDPGEPKVAIGLNGNNWRLTAAYVISLYQSDPKFKEFLDKLDPSKPILQIINDCMPLLTNDLTDKINNIFKLHERNAKEFVEGFKKAVYIVDSINEKRKKKNLAEVTLVCTLPINLSIRDVAPYAPPGSNVRGQYDYSNIPNSREAIYRITATIYQSANQTLREYDSKKGRNRMEAITVPFFGAEKNNNFFAPDGHFNASGEKFVGQKILSCFATRVHKFTEDIKLNLGAVATLQIEPEMAERINTVRR